MMKNFDLERNILERFIRTLKMSRNEKIIIHLHIQGFICWTVLVEHTRYIWTRLDWEFFRVTFVVVFVGCSIRRAWKSNVTSNNYGKTIVLGCVYRIEAISLESINLQSCSPFKSTLYSATPDEARKTATTTNQTMIKNCQTNGTRGKNNVDIMWPTAIDASSINSIAILTRFLKNIKITKMMRRTMAMITRNIIQVTTQNKKVMIKICESCYFISNINLYISIYYICTNLKGIGTHPRPL